MKEVYEVSPRELEFLFTDQISVFDKVIPTLVPHKGETLCRTAAHWFQVVEDGLVTTAGGITASIDLGLHLLRKHFAPELATEVADYLEYRENPNP